MGAFGVRGEVKIKPFTAAPEGVAAYGPLYDEAGALVLTPKRARPLKDAIAITAPEIASREQAEAMRGTRLYAPRDRFPPPEDEDEFYIVDLIGCRVEHVSGAPLGVVAAVHDFGAGDILEVKQEAGPTLLLPFTKDAAPVVDLKARRIVVDPPVAKSD